MQWLHPETTKDELRLPPASLLPLKSLSLGGLSFWCRRMPSVKGGLAVQVHSYPLGKVSYSDPRARKQPRAPLTTSTLPKEQPPPGLPPPRRLRLRRAMLT